jgi:hypothetical protein
MRRLVSSDELVQFDLNGFRITILRVLDEEDHEKRYNRCPGVDHQLPRITEAEERSRNRPQKQRSHRDGERHGTSGSASRPLCKSGEDRRFVRVHSGNVSTQVWSSLEEKESSNSIPILENQKLTAPGRSNQGNDLNGSFFQPQGHPGVRID